MRKRILGFLTVALLATTALTQAHAQGKAQKEQGVPAFSSALAAGGFAPAVSVCGSA